MTRRSAIGEIGTLEAAPVVLLDAGSIAGEMSAEDIPLGQGIDLQALLDGDDKPMQVVVEVTTGRSKRGWNYRKEALARYAGEVQRGGLPGYEGHQRPEDVAHQFKYPVTHWVGSKQVGDRFFFRGVIDKAAGELKRLIRAGRVNQVSIFGIPKLATVSGETHVIDADPISIDWTPLKRAGMATKLHYAGEMDRRLAEGEMPDADNKGGLMNFDELIAKLREVGAGPKRVIEAMGWLPAQIVGEMGAPLEVVAEAADKETWSKHVEAHKAIGELAEALGLESDASIEKIKERVKTLSHAETEALKAKFDERVKPIVGEMVDGDKPRAFVVRELAKNEALKAADDETVKKAVGELLEDEFVKSTITALSSNGGGTFSPKSDEGEGKNGQLVGATRKRASI